MLLDIFLFSLVIYLLGHAASLCLFQIYFLKCEYKSNTNTNCTSLFKNIFIYHFCFIIISIIILFLNKDSIIIILDSFTIEYLTEDVNIDNHDYFKNIPTHFIKKSNNLFKNISQSEALKLSNSIKISKNKVVPLNIKNKNNNNIDTISVSSNCPSNNIMSDNNSVNDNDVKTKNNSIYKLCNICYTNEPDTIIMDCAHGGNITRNL